MEFAPCRHLTQPCQCDSQKTRNTTRLKCCACHAKWRWTRPKCCAWHENCNASCEKVAKALHLPHKTTFDALQNTSEFHEVPHMPRKTKQRDVWNLQKWHLQLEARAAACTAAMRACRSGGAEKSWAVALGFLEKMLRWSIRAYDGTGAALGLCEAMVERWQGALTHLAECGRKELAGWFVHMQQLQKPVNHHWLIGGCLQNSLRQLSNCRRIKVDLRDFYRISFPPRSWRILEAHIGMWLFKCTSPAPARGVCPCKPTMPWCGLAALELGVGM